MRTQLQLQNRYYPLITINLKIIRDLLLTPQITAAVNISWKMLEKIINHRARAIAQLVVSRAAFAVKIEVADWWVKITWIASVSASTRALENIVKKRKNINTTLIGENTRSFHNSKQMTRLMLRLSSLTSRSWSTCADSWRK